MFVLIEVDDRRDSNHQITRAGHILSLRFSYSYSDLVYETAFYIPLPIGTAVDHQITKSSII